ncbi:MAG: hypothetical protein JXA62_09815 [Candidatus Aminicenantes bacterium]|nr:hypothetical protein [Candidatus Aminicenantes bacterium]
MDTPVAPTSLLYLRARDTVESRNQEIRKLRLRPEQLLALENRKFKDYRTGLKNFCVQLCRIPGDQLFNCGAGIRKASIDAYGNLQLCLMLRHPQTLFNLRKGTLWQGLAEFFPTVRKMKAKNPLYLKRCARCFLKNLCEQCPAVSWMESGMLDGWPQYFCEFTHAQARLIGLLKKGECAWEIDDWKQRIEKTCQSTTVVEPACLAHAETSDIQTVHSQEGKT